MVGERGRGTLVAEFIGVGRRAHDRVRGAAEEGADCRFHSWTGGGGGGGAFRREGVRRVGLW